MLVKAAKDIEPEVVRKGVNIRWLMTRQDGAPNFAMRVIELARDSLSTPQPPL